VHPNVYWTSGPFMPTPRGFAGAFLADNFFWVLGGSGGVNFYSQVEKFDTVNSIWSTLPWSLPKGRDSFGCGSNGDKAFIFGGRFKETEVTDTCLVILDLATGALKPSPPVLPSPIANPGCALFDGVFYLSGGRSWSGSQWDLHKETLTFTPPGPDFVSVADMLFDTGSMGYAAGPGIVMTCGGYPQTSEVLRYTVETNIWESRESLPSGRGSNAAVLTGGWFYSIGGLMIDMSSPQVDVMDVAGNVWYTINPLIERRFGAVAATNGSHIYVAGGLKTAGPAYIPLASLEIGEIF
jgi:hypothetical protein